MNNRTQSAEETIEEDIKGLLHTRQALVDKLQLLERRVEENVMETKNVACNVIDYVKHTATEFLDTTVHRIHPAAQGSRKTLVMVGIPVAIGLLAGWMKRRRRSGGVYAYYPPKARGADIMPEDGHARHRKGVYPFYKDDARSSEPTGSSQEFRGEERGSAFEPVSSLWSGVKEEFGKEGERLQKAAIMTGRSFAHDLVGIAVRSLIDAFAQTVPRPRQTVRRQDSDKDTEQSRAA